MFRKVCVWLAVIMMAGMHIPARAQMADMTIIRDTEIEDTLKTWLTPLLQAAGLGNDSVNIVLVQSPEVNAFVAGGANIFIYTGLIEKTDNPGELIGVMAHELGHIAGGHLISTRQAMERASYESILGAVIGVGAAIVSGEGSAAGALITGAGSMAQRRFLAHSRVNESSADQAALRFMQQAQINPQGLVTFLQKLESDELLPTDQQSGYMRTHPLSRDRVDAVSQKAQSSPSFNHPFDTAMQEQHARMKAKLIGFTNPGRVPWVYDDRDNTMAARYARTIAAYRNTQIETALKNADDLISAEPQNPYFEELKGQMLVEFGRVDEGVPHYRKALGFKPSSGLLRIALAHALLESKSAGNLQEVIDLLERALQDEPRSVRAHRLLATAYGKQGKETMAKLHLAEEALLLGRYEVAKKQAEAVAQDPATGGRAAIEARDIINQAEEAIANQPDKR